VHDAPERVATVELPDPTTLRAVGRSARPLWAKTVSTTRRRTKPHTPTNAARRRPQAQHQPNHHLVLAGNSPAATPAVPARGHSSDRGMAVAIATCSGILDSESLQRTMQYPAGRESQSPLPQLSRTPENRCTGRTLDNEVQAFPSWKPNISDLEDRQYVTEIWP
jgi:hypothetical protein